MAFTKKEEKKFKVGNIEIIIGDKYVLDNKFDASAPEALQKIINVGCDLVQGYVFSKPQPIEDLIDISPDFKWPMPLGFKKQEDDVDSENTDSILNKKSS